MAKLTWLGEDELHDGNPGPSFTTAFGGIKFPKNEPIEVSDKLIIAKARNNQFFEVTGVPGRPPKVEHEDPS
jgi:hypothetical protein